MQHSDANRKIVVMASLAIFAANLIYGFNVNIQKYLVPTHISALSMVFIRCAFGAVVLYVVSLFLKKEPIAKEDRMLFLMNGVLGGFLYFMLYLAGLSLTSPIDCTIIMGSVPVWTFILAKVYFKEIITRRKIFGLALGLGGSLLVILKQNSESNSTYPVIGDILCFGAAIAGAFAIIYTKKLTEKYSPLMIEKAEYMVGASIALPLVLIVGFDTSIVGEMKDPKILLFLSYVLIFPTILAGLFNNIAQKSLPVTVSSLYKYLVLIVASVIAIYMKQDTLSWYQPLAAFMIFGGVMMVTRKSAKKRDN